MAIQWNQAYVLDRVKWDQIPGDRIRDGIIGELAGLGSDLSLFKDSSALKYLNAITQNNDHLRLVRGLLSTPFPSKKLSAGIGLPPDLSLDWIWILGLGGLLGLGVAGGSSPTPSKGGPSWLNDLRSGRDLLISVRDFEGADRGEFVDEAISFLEEAIVKEENLLDPKRPQDRRTKIVKFALGHANNVQGLFPPDKVAVKEGPRPRIDVADYQAVIDELQEGLDSKSIKGSAKSRMIRDALVVLKKAQEGGQPLKVDGHAAVTHALSLTREAVLVTEQGSYDKMSALLKRVVRVHAYEEGQPKEFLKTVEGMLRAAMAEKRELAPQEKEAYQAAEAYVSDVEGLESFKSYSDADVSDSREALEKQAEDRVRFLREREGIAFARLSAVGGWDRDKGQAEDRVEKLLLVNVADYERRESRVRAGIKEYVVNQWWDYPELYDSLDAITPGFVRRAIQDLQKRHPEYQISFTEEALTRIQEQEVRDQLKKDLVDYDRIDPAILKGLREHIMTLWEYPEIGEGFEDFEEFKPDFIRHAAWDYQERYRKGEEPLLRPEIEDRVFEQRVEAHLRAEVDYYDGLTDRTRLELRKHVIDMWWDYEELRGESGKLDSDFVRRMADEYEYERGKRIELRARASRERARRDVLRHK